MQNLRAELHVHTVLSACADVEMIPPLIVQTALEYGIGLIAITDHNASANVQAVQQAAQGTGLIVLPGMELQTREEVHLLCLFQELDSLASWQSVVDAELPRLENNPEYFGEQFVVDQTGEFIRREPHLLQTSADISIDTAIRQVTELGGLAVPAHIDRKTFGLIANLGMLPVGVPVEAVEISRRITPDRARTQFPQIGSVPLIQGGDVHRLDEYLGANHLTVEAPTLAEIRLALASRDGRTLKISAS